MNDQRSYEGHMDWEYHNNKGPVDATSPFAQASQRGAKLSSFASPAPPQYPSMRPNPFSKPDITMTDSPFKTQAQKASQSSIFSSSLQNHPRATPFRNTAFTTPQRRVDELASEMSGAETSPALTDISEAAMDNTPEPDSRDDFGKMTITPARAKHLFAASPTRSTAAHISGRGELPRPRDARSHDRVRKRRRQFGDRDVGSVRPRLHADSDQSDVDVDDEDSSREGSRSGNNRRQRRRDNPGWLSNFLTTIHDHPNAPVIMSWWIQFAVNLSFALMGVAAFAVMGHMILADFRYAASEARSKLLAEMEACTHEYTKNRCAPKVDRLPALGVVCDEWEICMNQDPEKIKSLAISSKQMAITINEFFNVLSFKAWGFILSLIIIFLLANNLGHSKFRQSMASEVKSQQASAPAPSQHLFPPSQDPKQAFIWAPVTPKNLRRGIFLKDDASETDESPQSDVKAIMPSQTPSNRRSPSKGERDRDRDRFRAYSPSKRSPTKFY
ncbi:hypothetical protein ACKVV1_011196 [Pyricularia oryzae]